MQTQKVQTYADFNRTTKHIRIFFFLHFVCLDLVLERQQCFVSDLFEFLFVKWFSCLFVFTIRVNSGKVCTHPAST